MTYVEKLARLVYYLLIGVLGAGLWALLRPVVVPAIPRIREAVAGDDTRQVVLVALVLVVGGVLTNVVLNARHRSGAGSSTGSRVVWVAWRSPRWFVVCGLVVIACLLTLAGYDDSGWGGVAEMWGLAGMVALFWGILAGIVGVLLLAMRLGQRVVSRLSQGPRGPDGPQPDA